MLATFITNSKSLNIILADDDEDDRDLFTEVVADLASQIIVNTVKDGEELMQILADGGAHLPDIIFLDLNMPRKNGHQCLTEIRKNKTLHKLPVIIYSTSNSREQIDTTYKEGATLYISKPDSFNDLKKIIKKVFGHDWHNYVPQPGKEKFVVSIK